MARPRHRNSTFVFTHKITNHRRSQRDREGYITIFWCGSGECWYLGNRADGWEYLALFPPAFKVRPEGSDHKWAALSACVHPASTCSSTCVSRDHLWSDLTPPLYMQINADIVSVRKDRKPCCFCLLVGRQQCTKPHLSAGKTKKKKKAGELSGQMKQHRVVRDVWCIQGIFLWAQMQRAAALN